MRDTISTMILSEPLAVVTPTLDAPVLRVLAGSGKPLTTSTIARLAEVGSYHGIRKVLRRLVTMGIVQETTAGNTLLYELNREHLAAGSIVTLSSLRALLFDKIHEAVARWEISPVSLILFGSVARGDDTAGSDIDLLAVRPNDVAEEDEDWRDQVGDLQQSIEAWTGNPAAIMELAEDAVDEAIATRAAIVESLRSDAVVLSGESLTSLLYPEIL